MTSQCSKARLSKWCDDVDVKLVRLRSQTAEAHGTNEYLGDEVHMCAECRKANRGQFKIVKQEQTK